MFSLNIQTGGGKTRAAVKNACFAAAARQLQIMHAASEALETELKGNLEHMKASGNLQQSAKARVSAEEGKVTIKAGDIEGRAPYGMLLEYGTLNIAARPWLLPLFAKYSQMLARAFGGAGGRL